MRIPRRKNPAAPWLWQYALPGDDKWCGDLATAEHAWDLASQVAEVDE